MAVFYLFVDLAELPHIYAPGSQNQPDVQCSHGQVWTHLRRQVGHPVDPVTVQSHACSCAQRSQTPFISPDLLLFDRRSVSNHTLVLRGI